METIYTGHQCDGHSDCSDGSDEKNCKNFECNDVQFKCDSGHCYYKSDRCDGSINCRDKSDEFNCTKCNSIIDTFACHAGGGCIVKEWVCDTEPDCSDGSDEVNVPCRNRMSNYSLVPPKLRSPKSENKNSSLVYADDLLAVYFDDLVNTSTSTGTWPFVILGKAWAYAKKTYEPLHINFRLNVNIILLNKPYESCSTFSTRDIYDWGYPNAIECRSDLNNWAGETRSNFEILFLEMCEVIQRMRRQSWNDYWITCQDQISDLIFYDMYIYLKGFNSPQFLAWKADKLREDVKQANRNRNREAYCFRNWYLPIYEAYGGTEVLVNFFRVMMSYLKYHAFDLQATSLQNAGEFLHIWCEAAGTDLTYLYAQNPDWTLKNEQELIEAKESFHLNYTLNSCHLAYIDQHVAVYFLSPRIYETSFIKYVSDAWKYIKTNYGPFTNQSIHTIISQHADFTPQLNNCIPLNNGIKKRNNFVTIFNDIARDSSLEKNVFLDGALTDLAKLTLRLSQKTGIWPGQVVSGWSMTSIIVYDIYVGLNLSSYTNSWKELQLKTFSAGLQIGKLWFRDWYLHIYETSNKLNTLKYFLLLVNTTTTWNMNMIDEANVTTRELNMGEFVHFWSAAGRRVLLTDADNLFGWNLKFQNEFIQARKDFPNFNNYLCTNCDEFHWKSYIDQKNRAREKLVPIIIGIVLALFVITSILCLTKLILYKIRINRLNQTIRSLTPEELDEFLSGNLNESFNCVNASILNVPYNTDFELPKERLVVDNSRVLGSGEFGFVFHGVLKGDQENGTPDLDVAVKTVKPNVEISYFKALLSEIKILAHVGLHENIVSLLGTVTANIINREVCIVLELCPKGNLLHYLQRNRHRFQAPWTLNVFTEFQAIINTEGPLNTETEITSTGPSFGSENLILLSNADLLEWSCQIADGMNNISSKRVIHGDLAARNILLTFNNVAKISDFGLSRQLVHSSVYQKTSKTPIPWKWLAIESLQDKTFSIQSDVWSFGITLWEIFSLGKVPYPGKCWDKNFVNNLIAGERLQSPEYGNEDIYSLMLNCWKNEPTQRISFQEIVEVLSNASERISAGISYAQRQTCTYTAL